MPKPVRVAVVPYAEDPECLLIILSNDRLPLGREEAGPLAEALLRVLPPPEAAKIARELLARIEGKEAEGAG